MHRSSHWFRHGALICTALAILAFPAFAQWPTDIQTNMPVSIQPGEETTPKVIATMDGGCYVAWYENLTGNYNIVMQRYDMDGVPQWGENGMLITDHTQLSWITDYSVIVDWEDNVYVALNDVRHTTSDEPTERDWDIFVYKISPSGEFLWGADGIALSDNNLTDFVPHLLLTWEGNVVAAWERGDGNDDNEIFSVVMRKLDADGADLWDPLERTVLGGTNLGRPLMVEAENDGFYLQYMLGAAGERTIHIQSFDQNGNTNWDAPADLCEPGDIPVWSAPLSITDTAGGIFTVWYEAVGFTQTKVYAQHVDMDGAVLWGSDGMMASLSMDWSEHSPSAMPIQLMGGSGLAVFYGATDGLTPVGIRAQYITLDGSRSWGDDGQSIVVGDETHQVSGMAADKIGWSNMLCTYLWMNSQVMDDVEVRAVAVNLGGEFCWPDTSVVLSDATGGKGYLRLAVANGNRGVAVWQDGRQGIYVNPDIYLHTVLEDGCTGTTSMAVTAPVENHGYRELPIDVQAFVRGLQLGREGAIRVHVTGPDDDFFEFSTQWTPFALDSLYVGQNEVVLTLVDGDGEPIDPLVEHVLHIGYTPDADLGILWPEPETIVEQLPLSLNLDVPGFTLGVDGGVEVSAIANGEVYWSDVFTVNPIEVPSLELLENRIVVRLLGNDGEDLSPALADTVDFYYQPASGVDDPTAVPLAFALKPVQPNPFNASTLIRYEVPFEQPVTIAVYDLLGREVARLVDHRCIAGRHTVSFDGSGRSSGVYFVRMNAPSYNAVQRMVLIK